MVDTDLTSRLLIRSKLEKPPLAARLVPRPRLLELLETGLAGRMTLIVAPAGYGKTTVALQWLQRVDCDVAWISLDAADRDPERFARYLVAALSESSGIGFERCRALLEARAPPPWSYFCETLVAEMEGLSQSTVLALENYHAIDSPEVHQLVELMAERSPQAVHIVVMTRVDPPWPLVRWRTRGWLNELRARNLRFSAEETAEFFASTTDLALSPTTIQFLQQRTEGWIAGLRLAQLSLSESRDPDREGRELSGTDRQIADYLIDEVLAAQSPEVLQFLAASALMERFSAPLMDHLLADRADPAKAQRILSLLEKDNLFLFPLDSRRQWYRWHHLFRDLLLDHLGHLVSPDFRARVNREAGAWFAREGLVEEALRHWIPAGELDAAAELVGKHLHAVIAEDTSCRRLTEWLAIFPPGAMHGRPPLLVADGYCRIVRWDLQGLEALLHEVEAIGTNDPYSRGGDEATIFRTDIDAQWTFLLYWQGDVEGSLERSQSVIDAGPQVGMRPWTLASLYRPTALALRGRYDEATRYIDSAMAAAGPQNPGAADLLLVQAVLGLYSLDLDSCCARAEQMLALSKRISVLDYRLGHAPYLLGLVAYERNCLADADAWFSRLKGLRYVMPTRIFQDALLGQALVALARNDEEALRSHCDDARAFAIESGDPTSLAIVRSFELRIALLRGLPAPEGMAPPPADDHQSFWLEVPTVTWAMHLIAHPEARVRASALEFVDEARARVERYHNQRVATVLAVLRALALDVQGQPDAALDCLAATIHRAAPRGVVRSFVDCGPRVKELLDELARRSGSDEYIQTLRAAFGSTRQGPTLLGPSDVLTFRELETLELLAWRMTNKEIAARLAVSSAAVKKRLECIYAKLGVHDRQAAVAEAAARGLIEAPTR